MRDFRIIGQKNINSIILVAICALSLLLSFFIAQRVLVSTAKADEPVLSNVAYVTQVAAGGSHTCAIFTNSQQLYCWGDNEYGQLGTGNNVNYTTPQPVSIGGALNSKTIKQVSAGLYHTCAIAGNAGNNAADTVYCWGKNDDGQLGVAKTGACIRDGYVTNENEVDCADIFLCIPGDPCPGAGTWIAGAVLSPQAVTNPSGATPKKVSAGFAHTCAVYTVNGSGQAYCWGNNDEGQLGDGSGIYSNGEWTVKPTSSSVPVRAGNAIRVADISAGAMHTCSLFGVDVLCWGAGGSSQFGNNNTGSSSSPVANNAEGSTVATGFFYSCGQMTNNSVYCWGDNTSGQIGNGNNTVSSTPTIAGGALTGKYTKSVIGGYAHVCAIAGSSSADNTTDALYCWGENGSGQLGYGVIGVSANTPTQTTVPTGATGKIVKTASLGFSHTCAIYGSAGSDVDNILYCAGSNNSGELGNTGVVDSTKILTPVDTSNVAAPEPVLEVSLDSNEVTMSITPDLSTGSLTSASNRVNVVTNNTEGYEIQISAVDNDNSLDYLNSSNGQSLVSTDNSIASALSLNNNSWGFALPNTTSGIISNGFDTDYSVPNGSSKFAAVPTLSNAVTIIKKPTATSINGDDINFYYAAKVDATAVAGNYQKTIQYTITPKMP